MHCWWSTETSCGNQPIKNKRLRPTITYIYTGGADSKVGVLSSSSIIYVWLCRRSLPSASQNYSRFILSTCQHSAACKATQLHLISLQYPRELYAAFLLLNLGTLGLRMNSLSLVAWLACLWGITPTHAFLGVSGAQQPLVLPTSTPATNYSVGFSLASSYGSAAVIIDNALAEKETRTWVVYGDDEYQAVMARLSLESSRHLA